MILKIFIGFLIEEVLGNFDDLIKAGKIRYLGLSNETPWGFLKFLNVSRDKKLQELCLYKMDTALLIGYSIVDYSLILH